MSKNATEENQPGNGQGAAPVKPTSTGTAAPSSKAPWLVAGAIAIIPFVLIMVFAGVWAAAIKGYFGKRLHQDAGPVGEDPERTSVVNRMNASPRTFGIPPGPVAPPGGPCDFVVPDALDRSFLNEGYTFTRGAIGAPEGTHIKPDDAMVTTMKYLCDRHSRLGISHIISAYVNMRLNPEEQASRDPQIMANISAHNLGQAYDLAQIDYVYKVFRTPCPGGPLWNIEYWNDEPRLLLALPCRERINNVNTTFAGGPATAIPIRVAWQDQQNQFAPGGLPLNVNTALNTITAYLGLNPEALRFAAGGLEGMLNQIGRVYLEELLGLPTGALFGGSLPAILQNAFGGQFAQLVNQLPRPAWGTNFLDLVRSIGAGSWEQALGLLPGSLQGWGSPQETFRSIGLETIAAALRVPSEWLRDSARLRPMLDSLSADDLSALSSFGSLGGGQGGQWASIIAALRGNDRAAIEAAAESYGRQILAQTLGLPADAFSCSENEFRSCPDPYATIGDLARRTGLSEEQLRSLIGSLLSGQSPSALYETRGLPGLEQALGLPAGTLAPLISGGRFSPDAATISMVARRLGISTGLAQEFLRTFQGNLSFGPLVQQIGSHHLARAFRLSDPTALYQIANNTASAALRRQVEGELTRLSTSLGLPAEIVRLSQLFSGNFTSFSQVLSQLGGLQLGEIFGMSVNQIQQLLSGNLSALLNLPAFQQLSQTILSALNLNINQLTGLLNGVPLLGNLANIGNVLNGFLNITGVDQFLIMERVYRPEARRKVHLVLRELLDMPFTLDDIDMRVTQLITFSHERDVQPFEANGTLDRVYGRGRSKNFGLFSMKEAFGHLHIGY